MSNTECDRVKCVHNKMCNYLFELFDAQFTKVFDCNSYEEERPHGEWIPVSERLPEKNGNYLCTVDYGEDGIEVMQRNYWDTLGGFDKRYNKNDKVIAWMPLPEAYKEETDND